MTWLNILSNSLVVVFNSLTKSFLIHNLITHFLIDNNVYLLNKTSSVFRHILCWSVASDPQVSGNIVSLNIYKLSASILNIMI